MSQNMAQLQQISANVQNIQGFVSQSPEHIPHQYYEPADRQSFVSPGSNLEDVHTNWSSHSQSDLLNMEFDVQLNDHNEYADYQSPNRNH